MSDIVLDEQSYTSASAASGQMCFFPDSSASIPVWKDDSGAYQARSKNAAIAAQGAGFATDTYVTNANLLIPSFGLQAKTVIRWRLSASKTAAGVATPIYSIRIGTNGTVADTARLQLTGPAQTAATDTAIIEILLTVRSIGASGVLQGSTFMQHLNTATGFATNVSAVVEGTSAGFDNSALGGSYIGLSIDGGASAAWTLTQAIVEANW